MYIYIYIHYINSLPFSLSLSIYIRHRAFRHAEACTISLVHFMVFLMLFSQALFPSGSRLLIGALSSSPSELLPRGFLPKG